MEAQVNPTTQTKRGPSAHLMCGMPLWGVAGFLVCAYLAYLSYSHIRRGEFEWPHDWWSIATYGVWVLLMLGLLSETRCWRERGFFGLVLANFVLGFGLATFKTASVQPVRELRMAATMLWSAAALVSLAITFSPAKPMNQKKD